VSVRLFVALDLPEAARGALAAFRDAADAELWRPVPESSFHVTLAFIGHREAADVGRCTAALAGVEVHVAPPLAMGRAVVLSRVLAVAVEDPSGALGAVQAAVSDALAGAGVYEPEARRFRPHVTVARLRKGARPSRRAAAEPARVEFAGGPVVLYRSILGRGPANYEPLWSTG
jgi:RNA 2',3'-cyclic 3'-phosphodiesterase